MPCYRCGTRQVDPEPGMPSSWRRGLVDEHQVLVCPACHQAALTELTRCARCGGVHLVRRLDQVECMDCRLIRDAETSAQLPGQPDPAATDSGLAAEVARALQRIRGPG